MRLKSLLVSVVLCFSLTVELPGVLAELTPRTPQEEMDSFNHAFLIVPANTLPADLSYLLWLIAKEPPQPQASEAVFSPLAASAAKYAALVRTDGVYYAETTHFMGMDMKAEYWLKGEKFKKLDLTANEIIVFDGEWLYKYASKGKTGIKLPPDDPEAIAAIRMVRDYALSMVANSPYQQQDDMKIKGFDCHVFYLDIEMMGMKGNWLYVDKQTGALVKNRYGDEKGGMSVIVTKLDISGLGDEDFVIPAKVKITRP